MQVPQTHIKDGFSRFIEKRLSKIVEINREYAQPRIKITRNVSIALLILRLYLLVLVGILVYKFITLIR